MSDYQIGAMRLGEPVDPNLLFNHSRNIWFFNSNESRMHNKVLEREKQLNQICTRYMDSVFAPPELDRNAVQNAVGIAYRIAGLPNPEYRWFSSPPEAVRVAAEARAAGESFNVAQFKQLLVCNKAPLGGVNQNDAEFLAQCIYHRVLAPYDLGLWSYRCVLQSALQADYVQFTRGTNDASVCAMYECLAELGVHVDKAKFRAFAATAMFGVFYWPMSSLCLLCEPPVANDAPCFTWEPANLELISITYSDGWTAKART